MGHNALISLDLSKARFGGRGVTDLFWPVSRTEIMRARDGILIHLVGLTRETTDEGLGSHERSVLRVLFKWIALEALELFQAHLLRQRLLNQRFASTRIPEYFRHLEGSPIRPVRTSDELLSVLAAGPSSSKGIPAFLRRLGRSLQWNGIDPKLFLPADLATEIIALNHSSLVAHQARTASELVRYSLMWDWFGPLPDSYDPDARARSDRIVALSDSILDALERGFEMGGARLGEPLRSTLERWLRRACSLIDIRLELLQADYRPLPNTLWTANGGELWSALLGRAVRGKGGRVVGHEHGHGLPYIKSMIAQFVQLDHCDRFMTYNESQADALRRSIEPGLLIAGYKPEIQAATGMAAKHRSGIRMGSAVRSGGIRTLMYIGAPYMGDRLHLSPIHPDLVALDWQARLFAKLREWGISVLHKPHPEGSIRPPQGFAEHFGHRTLTQRFEQVIGEADAFFFDYFLTTTFPVALATGRPVILLDLDYTPWLPEAQELLTRRCRIVSGSVDTGRIEVDWDALREAICGIHGPADMTFVEMFHGSP